jgi:hypothetical protein
MLLEAVERLDAHRMKLDVVLRTDEDGAVIFWPISKQARRVLPGVLSRYPIRRLGYAVPRAWWKVEYDYIRTRGCGHIGSFLYL